MFAWKVPLVTLIFLKRSLLFTIQLFSSFSLHCLLKRGFLSLLVLLWNSAFKWVSVTSVHNHMGFNLGHNWIFYCFHHFLQFKSEFCNKGFLIWASIKSLSCVCWLYRASPSSATKNIINLILVLTIWWCSCVESSLVLLEEGIFYDQCIILEKLC